MIVREHDRAQHITSKQKRFARRNPRAQLVHARDEPRDPLRELLVGLRQPIAIPQRPRSPFGLLVEVARTKYERPCLDAKRDELLA
jgi:hypothetical protein